MGQCTSCESQRRGTSAGPHSPQFEFLPITSALSPSSIHQNEVDLTETESTKNKSLLIPQDQNNSCGQYSSEVHPSSLSPTLPPLNKGIRKLESTKSKKFYRISSRNKSKHKVTFSDSDPEVCEPVIKESLIYTSLRRIKLGKRVPPTTLTSTKLLPSPAFSVTETNGPVNIEDTNSVTEDTDMGNNSSHQSIKKVPIAPGNRSHVPKSSTFACNSKTRSSAISKQEASAVHSSASANNILKSVNQNKVCNYEDLVNANKVPVSPQTLQELNSSREEKKLLRDRFFSATDTASSTPKPKPAPENKPFVPLSCCSSISPVTSVSSSHSPSSPNLKRNCTPSPSKIPVPIANMGSIAKNGIRYNKNPVKEKRTFQYQPPPSQPISYSSSATQVPKLYSTEHVNGNGNINEGSEILKSRSLSAVGTAGTSAPTLGLSNLITQQQRFRFPSSSSNYGYTNINGSPGWKSGEEVFSSLTSLESGDFDPRRTSAPPKISAQRRNNFGFPQTRLPTLASRPRSPADCGSSDGEDSRRHTLYGWNKAAPKPSVLQKPIPTKPFFMLGYYGNGRKNENTKSPVASGFNGVSTGVVNQRKLFYQSTASTERKGPPEPMKAIPVIRSNTWIKGQRLEEASNVPKSQSTHLIGDTVDANFSSAGISQLQTSNVCPSIGIPVAVQHSEMLTAMAATVVHCTESISTTTQETVPVSGIPGTVIHEDQHHKSETDSISSKTSSNFPSRQEGAGTSTTSLNRSGRSVSRDREHNVISDSEFLIDDEISDQPQLTFTFKDSSSLIISPSSSEESLSSCDLMLDLTSRENRSSISSDSKPPVLPSPTSPNLNLQDLVSGIHELKEQLEILKEALEEQQQIGTEKDQLIERLTQENERLRKGNSKNAEADVKESKKVNNISEKEKEKKIASSFHNRRAPPIQRPDRMINAAAQTESPTRKKGVTYPEEKNDKVGQLVSFRIGRRATPASSNVKL